MAIGNWIHRSGETARAGAHPFSEERGVEEFARGLPASQPAAVMDETCDALESSLAEGIEPRAFARALRLLDNRVHHIALPEITRGLFRDARGDSVSDAAISALMRYFERIAAYYARALDEAALETSGADMSSVLLYACRGLYAHAQRKKYARLSYRTPEPEVWQGLHALRARARERGLIHQTTQIYPARPTPTSPHAEHLVAMMLETVPLGTLLPAQIQCLDLLLQRFAGGFAYSDKPSAEACFFIDPARPHPPQRWLAGLPIRHGMRFLGPGELRQKLPGLLDIAGNRSEVPDWVASSGCKAETYVELLEFLQQHWSDKPPQRRERRDPGAGELLVVHGFDEARRVLGAGKLVNSVESPGRRADRQFDEIRFGSVDPDKTTTGTFLKEELARAHNLVENDESALAERTPIADMSESGVGITLSATARWARVGELVAFRFPDRMHWELAVVRRMVRASTRLLVGLERIRGDASAVQALDSIELQAGPGSLAESTGGVGAILVSGQSNLLIVPPGHLAPGKVARVTTLAGSVSFFVGERAEAGRDFNIYALEPV